MSLTETPKTALAKVQISPLDIVQQALNSNVAADQLQALMDFAERFQANEARMAFNAAMAQFKANPPRINKNRHVKFGNTEYDHATLDNVSDALTAALSKVGISHKWDVKQEGGMISVSCVLTHEKGHSETTTLTAAADNSGSKNGIQAIGSAVTYLQRYTLLAATGMAVSGVDVDGQGTAPQMPEPEYLEWLDGLRNCTTAEELKKVFAGAYKAAEKSGDKEAMKQFILAKDQQKGRL
jgi:hypothetical protein